MLLLFGLQSHLQRMDKSSNRLNVAVPAYTCGQRIDTLPQHYQGHNYMPRNLSITSAPSGNDSESIPRNKCGCRNCSLSGGYIWLQQRVFLPCCPMSAKLSINVQSVQSVLSNGFRLPNLGKRMIGLVII